MKLDISKIFASPLRKIPTVVKDKLNEKFPNAINIDWEKKEELFEAVFYVNDIEHIAVLNAHGNILEHKKNIWPDQLTGNILNECLNKGEIMSVICIEKNDESLIEVIVKDENFNRTVFVFNDQSALVESRKL
jgi:hypothetical protein